MEAGADRLGLFMSVDRKPQQGATSTARREDSLADLAAIVRDAPAGTKIRFNLSCAFHCPFEGVVPEQDTLDLVEQVVALDPEMEIALADTTGNASPDQVRRIFGHAVASLGRALRLPWP